MAFYPLHLRSFKTLQTPQTINPTFSAPKTLCLKAQNLSLKMAFYPLHLRRMASSVVAPLAIRATGVRRDYHLCKMAPGPAGVGRVLRNEIGKILWVYTGGTDATEVEVRAVHQGLELLQKNCVNKVLIECDSSNVAEIPDGFPFEIQDEAEIPDWFPFELQDEAEIPDWFKVGDKDIPGHPIFLKREYEGETILVKVRIPDDLVTGYEGKDDDDDENIDDIKGGQHSLRLIIYICEGYMPNLVLICTGYREEISFDGMFFTLKAISDDESVYEGPDFNVPGAFGKYLKIRGINPSTIIYFWHEYMIKRGKST
ncbi:uncharacterized protein LOC143891971 [Tasmannia lanceolata]|uniref:uncharacterized protein LOC143891971 n=1 Tax=Tasmannia lanceolata TaxID=3420 RepID=UPI004063A004